MTPKRHTRDSGLVSLACTQCRKQHLKCDALQPSCTRCLQNGLLCHYLPSRRGGRRKPRQGLVSPRNQPAPTPAVDMNRRDNTPARSSQSTYPDLENISTTHIPWPAELQRNIASTETPDTSLDYDERFQRLFYENFHVAHPILVPSSSYSDRRYPRYLQLVVSFVGSHYVPSSPCQLLKDKVAAELTSNPDRTPCMVQAWLIYSIALYARGEWSDAQEALSYSAELALELGMHRKEFVSASHPLQSLEAESMRRTWWELYITEIFMAVPLKAAALRCSAVPPEVALPCEESAYASGNDIPEPRKILDFKRRFFLAEEISFSSFSYRIEAATILGRVLALNRLRDCHRDHLQAVENALVSWINHLPPKKMDIVDSYGNVDEMLFQAHLTIAYAAMLLHLPRSDLQSILPQSEDQFWPCAPAHLSSTYTRLVHSIKATEASKRLSDSISVCPNIHRHTPFIIPALALCGMIQLATSRSHSEECFDHHCNRVTLILGCLKSIKRTWTLGEPIYHRVRSSAAEILADSMERWNAEPLGKALPTESALSEAERTSQGPQMAPAVTYGQDLVLPELAPAFIDPACSSASFFSPMADYNFS